jgi:hypothetical protein
MNNPYTVLNLPHQNSDKNEIMKAHIQAMKDKKYSLTEIAIASRQLLDPAKRLAADFMFPARIKAKRPQKIQLDIQLPNISLEEINDNAFDSLK